jgi:cell division protein FtsN
MAQRDYVARSQKKRQPTKKRKPVQSVAWVKVVLAILVVASFVTGLWYLKDAGSEAGAQQNGAASNVVESEGDSGTDVENSAVSSLENEKDPLPMLAEEEWEFIEGLPSYSVEVDVAELPSSDRRYLMQCGSFRKQSQAEELKAKIAFQGLESQVLESKGSKGIWFRVVLGPYETKRDAERARHALRSAKVNRCQIWNWD